MNLTLTEHIDILDSRESMRKPFLWAIALHAGVILTFVVSNWVGRTVTFGASDVAGGAVGGASRQFDPAPASWSGESAGERQQVGGAADAGEACGARERGKAQEDAIALKMKEAKKPAQVASERQSFRPYKSLEDNQVTSKAAPQISSPMYSAQQGSGNVGVGAHTTLGSQFAAYASQVQSIVARTGIPPMWMRNIRLRPW